MKINPMQTTNVQKQKPVRGVIENTLHEISATLERSLFAEEISTRPGLLQSLDPRVKVVSTLALINRSKPFAQPGGDRRHLPAGPAAGLAICHSGQFLHQARLAGAAISSPEC